MTTLYGIKNCDSVRKARRWLDDHAVDYRFHDLRTDGLARARLQQWVKVAGWEDLLNRRGTTWRKLPESTRNDINRTTAMQVMLEQPAIIRRPILENSGNIHIGFDIDSYQDIFKGTKQA